MLYTNTDRKHTQLDARSVLFGLMDHIEASGSKVFGDKAQYRVEEDGDGFLLLVAANNRLKTPSDNWSEITFRMRAVVDQNGMLSAALMNDEKTPYDDATMELLCQYAGGSYMQNNGQIVRATVLPAPYDAVRVSLFYDAIHTHAFYDAKPEDGSKLRLLQKNGYTSDESLRGSDMLTCEFNGTRDDFVCFLVGAGFGVKEDGNTIIVKNARRACEDIAVLTINDLSNMSRNDRLWFKMNPEFFNTGIVVTASKSSFIYRAIKPDHAGLPWRDPNNDNFGFIAVDQFVDREIRIKRNALGLTTRALDQSFASISRNVSGDAVFFSESDMESIMENMGAPCDDKGDITDGALFRLMKGLELAYGGVEVKTVRDVSGNAAFDTVEVSVDGRPISVAMDNRFTQCSTPDGFCVISLSERVDKKPEFSIVKSYLNDIGGMDHKHAVDLHRSALKEKSAAQTIHKKGSDGMEP